MRYGTSLTASPVIVLSTAPAAEVPAVPAETFSLISLPDVFEIVTCNVSFLPASSWKLKKPAFLSTCVSGNFGDTTKSIELWACTLGINRPTPITVSAITRRLFNFVIIRLLLYIWCLRQREVYLTHKGSNRRQTLVNSQLWNHTKIIQAGRPKTGCNHRCATSAFGE